MARDVQRDLEIVNQLRDPFIRRSLKTALHLRRYFPIYVVLVVLVVAVSLVPSIQDRGHTNAKLASGNDTGANGSGGAGTATTEASSAPVGGPGAAGATKAAAPQRVAPSVAQSLAAANATGKTRSGLDCHAGVRQLPNSRYAAPCTAAFTGNNGGNTAFGVSGNEIVVVRRGFPDSANSQAVNAVVKQAGGADPAYSDAVRDVFVKYFDTQFELYGRKIKWVDYESQHSDSTQETLGNNREQACLDADYIHDTLHAFAVVGGKNTPGVVSAVFAECATQRHMMTFGAAPYYPESWYRAQGNYAWGGVMECERIEYQLAEYLGKRVAKRKAKWAGDPVTQNTTRKFGIYVPDNPEYQSCNNIGKKELADKYGVTGSEQYNYQLDVSRFAQQAQEAIVQFHARGVTTVILADDPISTIFLTEAAQQQGYFPEWIQIGTALNDVDNAARLFVQSEVNGHLWGPSQLGSARKLFGPDSEPYKLYLQLTGKKLSDGGATDGQYWAYLGYYSALQLAGPLLNRDTVAAGTFNAPPGGDPDFAVGYTSYRDGPDGTPGAHDHTAIDDAREIYWMGNMTSPNDGQQGTYVETYNGKRFKNGQWPAEEPPIYPAG